MDRKNLWHLLLDERVVQAVAQGRFHIHTAAHASEGLALLTGVPVGTLDATGSVWPSYAPDTVLGRAEATLRAYRRACLRADRPRAGRRR